MTSPSLQKPAALRAVNLAVGFRGRITERVVLKELSLTVARGELVCLVGPNGAGKSSLLRTIAKIQPPLAGSIELDGSDLAELSPVELARKLGVVLTERVEAGGLPGYRVVELGRYPYLNWAGTLSPRDHEVVRWAMTAVAVEHLASRDTNKMSDGERQRIMVARALAQEPAMLILDEPTAFLDVASRVELMGLLRRLARDQDLAVLLSTHDLELALRTADTVWLVDEDGRFLVGAPEDLVVSGVLGSVFESESVRFHAEDRAFRLVTVLSRQAAVDGRGLPAVLARAVLEREGYALTTSGPVRLSIKIEADSSWEAVVDDSGRQQGRTFADLAKCVRQSRGSSGEGVPERSIGNSGP